jgi:hypothetical protein
LKQVVEIFLEVRVGGWEKNLLEVESKVENRRSGVREMGLDLGCDLAGE